MSVQTASCYRLIGNPGVVAQPRQSIASHEVNQYRIYDGAPSLGAQEMLPGPDGYIVLQPNSLYHLVGRIFVSPQVGQTCCGASDEGGLCPDTDWTPISGAPILKRDCSAQPDGALNETACLREGCIDSERGCVEQSHESGEEGGAGYFDITYRTPASSAGPAYTLFLMQNGEANDDYSAYALQKGLGIKLQSTIACTSDLQCPAGHRCTNGQCYPNTCTSDLACPPGEICIGGACQAGCRADADCPEGTICSGNGCIPGCHTNGDCPPGYACNGNQCVPITGCTSDNQCGIGQVCRNGECVRGCAGDEDCPEGKLCFDGACRSGCRDDATCDPSERCENGVCVDRCMEGYRYEPLTGQCVPIPRRGGFPWLALAAAAGIALLLVAGNSREDAS